MSPSEVLVNRCTIDELLQQPPELWVFHKDGALFRFLNFYTRGFLTQHPNEEVRERVFMPTLAWNIAMATERPQFWICVDSALEEEVGRVHSLGSWPKRWLVETGVVEKGLEGVCGRFPRVSWMGLDV